MRIHITGNAGSGKSTFAKSIGDILGVHVYGLDKIVWKEGWKKTPLHERKSLVLGLKFLYFLDFGGGGSHGPEEEEEKEQKNTPQNDEKNTRTH